MEDPNTAYIWYRYTYGATSGSYTLTAPQQPGYYEFRYLLRNGYVSGATSRPLIVNQTQQGYSLTVSPTTVAAGDSVTLSWTSRPGSAYDWIALYRVGDPP